MAATPKRDPSRGPKEEENGKVKFACAVPPHPELNLPIDLDPNRAGAIVMLANKWANGTVLHYWFFDEKFSTNRLKGIVREAFGHWKEQGIGLEFTEVDDPR